MEKIDFSFIITKEDFGKLKSYIEVQEALDRFCSLHAEVMKSVYEYVSEQTRNERALQETNDELKKLKERINDVKKKAEEAQEKTLKEKYTQELLRLESDLEKIENRLNNNQAHEQMVQKMKFQTNQLKAEGIDHLAEELGKWFEQGHAGPGTVTYKDLRFTAQ